MIRVRTGTAASLVGRRKRSLPVSLSPAGLMKRCAVAPGQLDAVAARAAGHPHSPIEFDATHNSISRPGCPSGELIRNLSASCIGFSCERGGGECYLSSGRIDSYD